MYVDIHPMCTLYIRQKQHKFVYTHGRLMYYALFIVMDVGKVVVVSKLKSYFLPSFSKG